MGFGGERLGGGEAVRGLGAGGEGLEGGGVRGGVHSGGEGGWVGGWAPTKWISVFLLIFH